MSKPFSFSARISEYCVLYSGFLYLHANSVSGYNWKRVSLFTILGMFQNLRLFCRAWSGLAFSNGIDSTKIFR